MGCVMVDFKGLTPQFTICKIITALACAIALPSAYAPFYIQVDSGQATVSGVIAGAVSVEKTGVGSVILSAINSYTGSTVVKDGEVLVTGSVAGDVIVNPTSVEVYGEVCRILGGTGTIEGSVASNSIVRTGETAGDILTIVTDYVQSNGATFLAKASPQAFDSLAVTGAATLQAGAVLKIFVQNGLYPAGGVTYPILQAGSISGTFSSIINSGTDVGLSLSSLDYSTPGQIKLTIFGGGAVRYNDVTVTQDQITDATGPVTMTNCSLSASALASAAVPVTLNGNTAVNVTTGTTVDVNNGGLLSSAVDSTTTFSGGGGVNLTGNGSGLQGILYVDDVTFAMNCSENTPLAASEIIIEDGTSRLKGTGYYNHRVTNNGRIKPGNSIGTMHIGSYIGMDTSTMEIEFNATNSSKLAVTGETILDGTLQLIPEVPSSVGPTKTIDFNPGSYTYQIVTTGDDVNGVQGTFANVSVPDVNTMAYTLSYANDYNALLVNLQVSAPTTFITSLENDGSANFTSGSVSGNNLSGAGYKTILAPYTQTNPKTLDPIALNHNDATAAADSVLTAAGLAISSGGDIKLHITHTGDSFRQLNLASMGRAPHKDRLHAVLHALQENGPISFGENQHRIWFSPYTTMGRTNAKNGNAGNHRWTLGTLAGYEYRNVAKKRLIGLILGGSTGLQTVTGTPESWTRSKSLTTGFYAGTNLFNDATRVESIGLWIHNVMKKQRSGTDATKGAYHAISKIKQDTLVGDMSASYRFKINDNWSLRPNIGNTYFYTNTGSSTETNTPSPINTGASSSQTSQWYCGIGGRYQWENNKLVYRITSVFEAGREYYKKGTPIKTTTFDSTSLLPPQVLSTNGETKKITTKYLTLNGVVLDEEKGLKHVLSYSGQFSNGSRTHSIMLKFEKRF